MARKISYTYLNWWKGKFCFQTSPVFFNEEQETSLKRVPWKEINETDSLKIKKKQAELFNQQVSEKYSNLKSHFNERFENSRVQDIFLREEIEMLSNLMFNSQQDTEILIFKDYGLLFEKNELKKIQSYINFHIKKGNPLNYDFMHSPNYLYQKQDFTVHQVYAESIWRYFEWLHKFQEELKSQAEAIETKQSTDVPEKPTNPRPDIFINDFAYQMFKELVTLTVSPKTYSADFSFIFHKLRNSAINAIYPTVTHSNFIKFLLSQNYPIKAKKLNYKNQNHKKAAYEKVHKDFYDLVNPPQSINSAPKNPQN